MTQELVTRTIDSPIGPLTLVASAVGLRAVLWPGEDGTRVRRALEGTVRGYPADGGEAVKARPVGGPQQARAGRGVARVASRGGTVHGRGPDAADGPAGPQAGLRNSTAVAVLEEGDTSTAAAILDEGDTPTAVVLPDRVDTSTAVAFLDEAQVQLAQYFAGTRQGFELALDPVGTPFQRQAWAVLLTIPYGQTISYAAQGEALGSAGRARAVGAANGRNPLSIVVPCHRVVSSSGSLAGFAGGVDAKAWLLAHEQRVLARG